MTESYFVRLGLPPGLAGEAREAFSSLVAQVAGRFSFQGLEDWSVDLGSGSRVLGAETEFHDLTRLGVQKPEMRVYFARKQDGLAFGKILRAMIEDLRVGRPVRLAPRDWMKLWRKHYKTQTLRAGGRRLFIVPAWKKVPSAGASVRITPGQAFGTGTHPTTQLCLELLLGLAAPPSRVLDFGAGTGVLAIAAEKLFRSWSVAVESDRVALEQCRKNARLNRCRRMKFSLRLPRGRFDLVFANVLVPVLLEHRVALMRAVAPGGVIFLSGILASEADSFLKQFRGPGFRERTRLTRGDWAAIALERTTAS